VGIQADRNPQTVSVVFGDVKIAMDVVVEHFVGTCRTDSPDKLIETLNERDAMGLNAFIVSAGACYPYMTVLVNHTSACVHYFPADGHPGYTSSGRGGDVGLFAAGSPGEMIEVDGDAIVSCEDAVEAVLEFQRLGGGMPRRLAWREL
jgi:hypothetical protein